MSSSLLETCSIALKRSNVRDLRNDFLCYREGQYAHGLFNIPLCHERPRSRVCSFLPANVGTLHGQLSRMNNVRASSDRSRGSTGYIKGRRVPRPGYNECILQESTGIHSGPPQATRKLLGHRPNDAQPRQRYGVAILRAGLPILSVSCRRCTVVFLSFSDTWPRCLAALPTRRSVGELRR
jgi:hypothetical protein